MQARLKQNSRPRNSKHKPDSVFTELLKCGECGCTYYSTIRKGERWNISPLPVHETEERKNLQVYAQNVKVALAKVQIEKKDNPQKHELSSCVDSTGFEPVTP